MPLLAIPFPTIDPVAIAIGPFAIRWYALAYVAGLARRLVYARRLAQRTSLWGALKRPTLNDIDDLIVWVALGVVLGGRIGYVLFYKLESYLSEPARDPRGLARRHGVPWRPRSARSLAILMFARSREL